MSTAEEHDDLRQVDGHEGWQQVYRRQHAGDGYKADESTVHYPSKGVPSGG